LRQTGWDGSLYSSTERQTTTFGKKGTYVHPHTEHEYQNIRRKGEIVKFARETGRSGSMGRSMTAALSVKQSERRDGNYYA
jgi:hypothetical protein